MAEVIGEESARRREVSASKGPGANSSVWPEEGFFLRGRWPPPTPLFFFGSPGTSPGWGGVPPTPPPPGWVLAGPPRS